MAVIISRGGQSKGKGMDFDFGPLGRFLGIMTRVLDWPIAWRNKRRMVDSQKM